MWSSRTRLTCPKTGKPSGSCSRWWGSGRRETILMRLTSFLIWLLSSLMSYFRKIKRIKLIMQNSCKGAHSWAWSRWSRNLSLISGGILIQVTVREQSTENFNRIFLKSCLETDNVLWTSHDSLPLRHWFRKNKEKTNLRRGIDLNHLHLEWQ